MVVRVDSLRKGEGGELGAVRGSWKKGRSRGNYCTRRFGGLCAQGGVNFSTVLPCPDTFVVNLGSTCLYKVEAPHISPGVK